MQPNIFFKDISCLTLILDSVLLSEQNLHLKIWETIFQLQNTISIDCLF